jgi:dCMP deaminase
LAAAATAALLVAMLLHRRRRPPPSSTPPQHIRPLPDFSTLPRVGWRWERWKTADENWLDLAYLVARASEAKDGHMGCCIVRDPHGREPSLISTTINCGIYGRYRSDLHAEAAAVSDCARRGEKLEGCTLYVTRAPCPRCHCLIAAAGIRRVVAPTDLETDACVVSAEEFGIEIVKFCVEINQASRRWRGGRRDDSAHRSNCGTRRRGRPGATGSRKNIEITTRSSPRA